MTRSTSFLHLRRMLTSPITRLGGGRRRFHCDEQDSPVWIERLHDAASLWKSRFPKASPADGDRLRIADLGAGNERLRRVLESELEQPHAYFGYDLHPQQPSTRRADLTVGIPGSFDLCICIGLLEYIPPHVPFAAYLSRACRYALISFAFAEAVPDLTLPQRERWGWVRHDTRGSLEATFEDQGFVLEAFRMTDGGQQGMWLWSRPAP